MHATRFFFRDSVSPPIPPVPVGIRFRMYIQATTAGGMVAWAARTPTGTGGLPQPTVIVMCTTWSWVVAISAPRITLVGPTGLLSAASPPKPVGIRFRMYCLEFIVSMLVH